jgi:chemotaxis protein histidine kinase CheA
MGFEPDEEILQDFLVEAGELLEQLSEQLVELEQNPEDRDLLNAIFRGFHTVKGGAGFLQLDALVGVCHIAENVFDRLRNGQISITSELMDVVLQTLDAVNVMFDQVKSREDPTPATPELLLALKRLANGESLAVAEAEDPPAAEPEEIEQEETVAEVATPAAPQPAEGDITDDEFESLLDALGDEGSSAETAKGPADAITMPTGIAPKQASPTRCRLMMKSVKMNLRLCWINCMVPVNSMRMQVSLQLPPNLWLPINRYPLQKRLHRQRDQDRQKVLARKKPLPPAVMK